jgi:hypothetical protein
MDFDECNSCIATVEGMFLDSAPSRYVVMHLCPYPCQAPDPKSLEIVRV